MGKVFDVFISFNGECREAVNFYAKVFNSKVENLMTFSDSPPQEGYTVADVDKDRIMYACVPIYGSNIMFCDVPSGMTQTKGDNISPTLGTDDKDEIRRVFDGLKEGGKVDMELQKTFWSELFGSVTDRFGISWQISHYVQ